MSVSEAFLRPSGRAGQLDAELSAEHFIAAGLVDPIRQDGAGIAAKFPEIIFHSGFKVTAFVEIAPAGLLQIGVSVHHGKVQFLPEFGVVWTFAPLDRSTWGCSRLTVRSTQIWVPLSYISCYC